MTHTKCLGFSYGGAYSPKPEPEISSVDLTILKYKLRIVKVKLLISHINV